MLSSRPPAFLDYLPGGELSGEALATPPRTSATAFATGHNGNKRRGLWRHWLTFGAAGPGRPGRPSLPFIHASASENTRDPRCVFWPPKMCGMTLREPRLLDILLLEKKFPCRVADKAGWLLQGAGPRAQDAEPRSAQRGRGASGRPGPGQWGSDVHLRWTDLTERE